MMSILGSLRLTVRDCLRSRAALQFEVLALRHQLQVRERSRPRRLRLSKADRLLWVWFSRVWTKWRTALVIVTPETVSPGIGAASACSGRGRAVVAWVDRPCRLTSAR